MTYLAKEKRFVMVANRFRWHGDASEDERPAAPPPQAEGEDVAFAEGDDPPFERVNSGLCFDKVRRVRYRGMEPGHNDEILNLLTIDSRPGSIPPIFPGENRKSTRLTTSHSYSDRMPSSDLKTTKPHISPQQQHT